MLDNCPSHKTANVIKLLNALKISKLFSAPASYLVAPIERLFGALKSIDFDQRDTPIILKNAIPAAGKFTKTQTIMGKISEYLCEM